MVALFSPSDHLHGVLPATGSVIEIHQRNQKQNRLDHSSGTSGQTQILQDLQKMCEQVSVGKNGCNLALSSTTCFVC
jgi:hypothetical protein